MLCSHIKTNSMMISLLLIGFSLHVITVFTLEITDTVGSFEPSPWHLSRGDETAHFHYESVQLDEDALSRLRADKFTAKHARLFAFDSGEIGEHGGRLRSGECKSFPEDASWPSAEAWAALDKALGQNALMPTVPLAAPCYRSWGIYNETKCDSIRLRWPEPLTHESDPTSTMWPIYQGRTCLPTNSSDAQCTLGGFPAYAVNVSTVQQVQLAVNFARNLNLRLVIKNTGHCYLGKSNGAGSLSVWTHNLKDIKLLENYQTPEFSGKALKIGAGVTIREVYEAAHKLGVTAVGGICDVSPQHARVELKTTCSNDFC
jgi:hypothetical protein